MLSNQISNVVKRRILEKGIVETDCKRTGKNFSVDLIQGGAWLFVFLHCGGAIDRTEDRVRVAYRSRRKIRITPPFGCHYAVDS